ncbi:TIGR03663 family protein [Halobacteriales archaeon SW_7_68_16]|nr:MAG: TIGR03663 family protein [Halobacteriales archaeon SW_7_68_16]
MTGDGPDSEGAGTDTDGTVRYLLSGRFEYRAIVHGPFLPIVNRHVFALLGPTDLTSRLVVAVVGGVAPLAAWLFRDRLRPTETVVLGGLLALDPILVYYSRFMRSDLIVASAMVFALGFVVRAIDTGRHRHVYAAVAAAAVGLAAKENAILYPIAWLGAGALLLDGRALRRRLTGDDPYAVFREYAGRIADVGWAWRRPLALGAVQLLALIVFFYGPRGGGYDPPAGSASDAGLWSSIAALDPGAFGSVVAQATVGSWGKFVAQWGGGGGHQYLPYLEHYVRVLALKGYSPLGNPIGAIGAGALAGFAVVGFLADRYGADCRDLIALGAYWGGASVLCYPIVADIQAPWLVSHAVVALAFPAAVGLSLVARRAIRAHRANDPTVVAAGLVVLLVVAGSMSYVAVDTSYDRPQDRSNGLVQYAQPGAADMGPVLDDLTAVAPRSEGTDILYYGDEFDTPGNDESLHDQPNAGGGWFRRLPFPWYFEGAGMRAGERARVSSTASPDVVAGTEAPIVIALEGGFPNRDTAADVDQYLTDSYRYRGQRFLYDTGTVSSVAIFVDADAIDGIDARGTYNRSWTERAPVDAARSG